MPRGRGGVRTGTPGHAYPNRSDLRTAQPVRTAPGQAYGVAGAQAAAQHTIPLSNVPATPAAAPSAAPGAAPTPSVGPTAIAQALGGNQAAPGQVTPLHAPTERPNEPLTAGLTTGAGPGPEALGAATANPILNALKGAYATNPNPDLLALIKEAGG